MCQSINESMNESVNQSINQSINQSKHIFQTSKHESHSSLTVNQKLQAMI